MKNDEERLRLPWIWCDFNAQGWSGAPDDTCYYVWDEKALDAIGKEEGMKLIIYMEDGPSEAVACIAVLESYKHSWRLRPLEDSLFRQRTESAEPGEGGNSE
jgi:hypothetical protein